ncbi:hypothetical protein EDD18DRAFT_1083217, partial [Armillaria luteobubalina]
GLDPKHAKAFNFTTTNTHFQLLQKTIDLESVPLSNIYNFDELSIQLGSGRKSTGEEFFFGSEDQS